MQKIKKKNFAVLCLVVTALLFLGFFTIMRPDIKTASASALDTNLDYLTFTEFTTTEGEQEYKVAIRTAFRSTVEIIIIPSSYNDKRVSEIADNGFASCSNLKKVSIPSSIRVIGNNAFINCTKLESAPVSKATVIGSNAFGMCNSLKNIYLPKTITKVGSTAFRNAPTTVFIQTNTDTSEWNSTWSDYHTGTIKEDASAEDILKYREILNGSNTVIGYELQEEQWIGVPDEDIVIYDSISFDGANYLPVYNICPEAFLWSQAKSVRIMRRPSSTFTHKINLRSGAFARSTIGSIIIDTDIELNHPSNLYGGAYVGLISGDTYTGDTSGKSTYIFNLSEVKSVTLPNGLDLITDGMFSGCSSLNEIKISGYTYTGDNRLPNVDRIGSNAFDSCIALDNIFIPDSVLSAGSSIFNEWGINRGQKPKQIIDIDFVFDAAPIGLKRSQVENGLNAQNVTIRYKAIVVTVTLNANGGQDGTESVQATYNEPMPEDGAIAPTRVGYKFLGYFEFECNEGKQYYTEEMESQDNWDKLIGCEIFARWEERLATISYELNGGINHDDNPNEVFGSQTFTLEDPTRAGFDFGGWFTTSTFEANSIVYEITGANFEETFYSKWIGKTYTLTYYLLIDGTNWYTTSQTYKSGEGKVFWKPSTGFANIDTWYFYSDFSGDKYSGINENAYGNGSFYGRMDTVKYTLTFYMNGAFFGTITYTVLDNITLGTPAYYSGFSGWRLGVLGAIYTQLPAYTYGNYTFYATGTYYNPGFPIYDPGTPQAPNPQIPPGIIINPGPGFPPIGGGVVMSSGRGATMVSIEHKEVLVETMCEESAISTSYDSKIQGKESEDN